MGQKEHTEQGERKIKKREKERLWTGKEDPGGLKAKGTQPERGLRRDLHRETEIQRAEKGEGQQERETDREKTK